MNAVADDYEAAQRARLLDRLTELTRSCPKSIWSASVQKTRQWKKDHAGAVKAMKSSKATNAQLQSAVASLEAYE